jgi:type I restriction enzyme S subunit
MGKISYSDHVKKSDISVVIAEIIFQSLKKTHKLLPLSKVVDTSSGGTPSRTNQSYYGGEIPWLKSGEMNDSLISQAEEFITEEGLSNSSAKIFPKGTLLVAMYGATAGKTGILDIDASTNQAVCAVTPKDKSTNRDFLFWFFRANRFYFIDISRGGAQPNISQSVIGNTDFPIVEDKLQKNIALFLSNLEETKEAGYSLIPPDLCQPVKLAFDYLSCLQKLEYENKNQTNIVSKLKQAILQEAIAGQLTAEWRTQNPMQKGNPDTDAAALLAKIKSEKQRLIADGNLKKEKPLAEIAIDEILFSLPDNWVWCRLGSITTLITDGKHGDCQNEANSGYYFLSAKDVKNGKLIYENARQITFKDFTEVHRRTNLEAGDICLVNTGATIGKTAIVQSHEFTSRTTFQKSVAVIKVLKSLTSIQYLEKILISETSKLLEVSKGSAINNLLLGDLRNLIIPLPPLAEQKAIVEKVDKLMNIIDKLEQQIKHRKQLAEDLKQTVLREAFE